MRTITILLIITAWPALADTVPTTNNRSNTINGNISGDINGNIGTGSDQNQTRRKPGQNQCTVDRNGRTNCP